METYPAGTIGAWLEILTNTPTPRLAIVERPITHDQEQRNLKTHQYMYATVKHIDSDEWASGKSR
jgi:hypothetical protein